MTTFRQEIDSTLERLKRAERELSAKAKELNKRELQLKEKEANWEQQFRIVVSLYVIYLHV